jgi:hypothetical protein
MMPLKLDMADVLGSVVTGNAPSVSPDAPDFANLIAAAGQGGQASVSTAVDPHLSFQTPNTPAPSSLSNDLFISRLSRTRSSDLVGEDVSMSLDTNGVGVSGRAPTAPVELTKTIAVATEQEQPSEKPANLVALVRQPDASGDASLSNAAPIDDPAPRRMAMDVGDDEKPKQAPVAPELAFEIVPPALLVTPVLQAPVPTGEAVALIANEAPVSPASTRQRPSKSPAVQGKTMSKGFEVEKAPLHTSPTLVLLEPSRPLAEPRAVQADPIITLIADNRPPPSNPSSLPERALPTLVERMVAFTPTIIDAARDLAQIGDARDMKFNVRPETLGPVAVTIERTEVGQNLRLSVETHAAVHAVRQAEPVLNDPRHGNPFVNVTVDMTASDQRGRSSRAAPMVRQDRFAIPDEDRTAPAVTGRYA